VEWPHEPTYLKNSVPRIAITSHNDVADVFKLSDIFDLPCSSRPLVSAKTGELRRDSLASQKGLSALVDRLSTSGIACAFVRFAPTDMRLIRISLPGIYRLLACAAGGWLELPADRETLSYLAEVMIKLEEHDIGLPPSLLGANCEAVARRDQIGCPFPTDVSLRVANLSRRCRVEFLVVNPTVAPCQLSWETIAPVDLNWQSNGGTTVRPSQAIELPAKGWIVGCADVIVAGQILFNEKAQAHAEGALP
jgi:hypothetical protein